MSIKTLSKATAKFWLSAAILWNVIAQLDLKL